MKALKSRLDKLEQKSTPVDRWTVLFRDDPEFEEKKREVPDDCKLFVVNFVGGESQA